MTEEWTHIACPCTTFEQDEDCPVGFPSLLCSVCDGKGIATIDDVVALAAEMLKIAEQVDELADPFAAWETIDLLKTQNDWLREAEEKLANKVEDLIAEFGDNPTAALQCVTEWLELRRAVNGGTDA